MLLPSLRDRADYVVRFLFGSFIAIGCFLVVWPFATAMSVAAVIAIVSWPLFKRVRKEVGGRNLVATLIMVSLLAILIVLPIAGLSLVSAQEIPTLIRYVREWIASGFTVPEELKEIPFVGEWAYTQAAHLLGNKEELAAIAQKLFDPVSRAALAGAVMLGDGLLQLFLMLFVIFFFYRDGEVLSQKSLALLTRQHRCRSSRHYRQHNPQRRLRHCRKCCRPRRRCLNRLLDRRCSRRHHIGCRSVRLICRSYRASLSLGSCCFLALLQRRSRHGDLPRALGFACSLQCG